MCGSRARLSYRIRCGCRATNALIATAEGGEAKESLSFWYSAMQIHAVGCAHTSALIHCSRLSLNFRTLVCYSKLWPCRRNAVSLGLFLLALVKFVHGRKWAKSQKIAVHCALMGYSRGLLRPSVSNPATRDLEPQPLAWNPKNWFSLATNCFLCRLFLFPYFIDSQCCPSPVLPDSQNVLLTLRLCPFLKWEQRVAIMTTVARKALIRNGPKEECAEGLM